MIFFLCEWLIIIERHCSLKRLFFKECCADRFDTVEKFMQRGEKK